MIKVQKKFTRFLLLIVSSLGLCSTALLLTDPPPSAENDLPPSLFGLSSSILTANREPSSMDAVIKKGPPEMLVELNCSEAPQVLETSSYRFRLKGESCTTKENAPLTTQVQNKSNGYIATVFHKSPLAFTTDYINLSEGKNDIHVVFETEAGSIEKNLTVVRVPASVKR